MIDLFLASIILALIVDRWFLTREYTKQNEKYMKALMAKNLQEFDQSVIMDKSKPEAPKEPEFVPIEQADEKLWSAAIKNLTKDNGGQS